MMKMNSLLSRIGESGMDGAPTGDARAAIIAVGEDCAKGFPMRALVGEVIANG